MKKIKDFFNKCFNQEYCKSMLNFILFNCMAMMWVTYILAWCGREKIAESLSQTIVTAVIGTVIPYFISKTIENISKYGSRINHTTSDCDVNLGNSNINEN